MGLSKACADRNGRGRAGFSQAIKPLQWHGSRWPRRLVGLYKTLSGTKYNPFLKHVTIYTDGSCSGNPGPGGWAAILQFGPHERVITGDAKNTTNNRMELTAALEALRTLTEPCQVDLHTDSAYLVRAFNDGWLDNWQRNGWRNASKKPIENKDLWLGLLQQAERHRITWVKVKGHADNDMNNRVDELAVAARDIGRTS